jgi:hypothetical protein
MPMPRFHAIISVSPFFDDAPCDAAAIFMRCHFHTPTPIAFAAMLPRRIYALSPPAMPMPPPRHILIAPRCVARYAADACCRCFAPPDARFRLISLSRHFPRDFFATRLDCFSFIAP